MPTLVCPTDIKNADRDEVSFVIVKDESSLNVADQNDICYRDIMRSLEQYAFRLKPRQSCCSTNEIYFKWMTLCRDNGLIPPESNFTVENGENRLFLPAGKYDRHWMYAAVCCYRFADSYARMVWLVVKNMEESNGVFTFWQALHYALGREYSYGTGHSFSQIISGTYGANCKFDLSHSLALPLFFKEKDIDHRKKLTSDTYRNVDKVANTLSDHKPFKIQSLDELLSSKWTPLYCIVDPTYPKLRETYDEIVKSNNGRQEDSSLASACA